MIQSFRSADTERLFCRERVRKFQAFERIALRKLTMLHAASSLEDLAKIPGNRLEALKADRKGQHSIRVNDQWRICFTWRVCDAHDVEIVDYLGGTKWPGN